MVSISIQMHDADGDEIEREHLGIHTTYASTFVGTVSGSVQSITYIVLLQFHIRCGPRAQMAMVNGLGGFLYLACS
jgi:hypothetical protein